MPDLQSTTTVTRADVCPHDDLDLSATGKRAGGGVIATVTLSCKSCGLRWTSPLGKTGKYTQTPSTVFVPQPGASNGETAKPVQTTPKKSPDPSLARSKLNRDGLKAGAVAPEFTLPHIGGDNVSLSDFRGRRVLLVFSDPNCGPCDAIAPRLQELHLNRPDIQVIVVSRRDAAAVRSKSEKYGTTYPILMQKQWEISKEYGMFATPIGYLIGPDGVLLRDVAVGVDPIMALTKETAEQENAQ